MTKLHDVHKQMKDQLDKYPDKVDVTSKGNAVQINQVLESFRQLVDTASKITKKYFGGQEILTIDHDYYDSLQEYYIYLNRNHTKIKECLEEITRRVESKLD